MGVNCSLFPFKVNENLIDIPIEVCQLLSLKPENYNVYCLNTVLCFEIKYGLGHVKVEFSLQTWLIWNDITERTIVLKNPKNI